MQQEILTVKSGKKSVTVKIDIAENDTEFKDRYGITPLEAGMQMARTKITNSLRQQLWPTLKGAKPSVDAKNKKAVQAAVDSFKLRADTEAKKALAAELKGMSDQEIRELQRLREMQKAGLLELQGEAEKPLEANDA
jgi:hypothetical protein